LFFIKILFKNSFFDYLLFKKKFKNQLEYNISCDLSAAPAPIQSAGSGKSQVLIGTDYPNTDTAKFL
jgi:hypothetical protein